MNLEKKRKKPGRTPAPGPPNYKRNILLPDELTDWAKEQPEGLSGLVRKLLEDERKRREAARG